MRKFFSLKKISNLKSFNHFFLTTVECIVRKTLFHSGFSFNGKKLRTSLNCFQMRLLLASIIIVEKYLPGSEPETFYLAVGSPSILEHNSSPSIKRLIVGPKVLAVHQLDISQQAESKHLRKLLSAGSHSCTL